MLWQLFISFAKVGIMTFGGGYAMLPILEREIVHEKKWVTMEELLDCYAVGQTTPGVIAVNTSTYVGYKKEGFFGAIFATLGVITPSLMIITMIAKLIQTFSHLGWVGHAFAGVRIAVCALVLRTVWKLAKNNIKEGVHLFVFFAAYIAVGFFGLSPIIIVLAVILFALVRGGKYA